MRLRVVGKASDVPSARRPPAAPSRPSATFTFRPESVERVVDGFIPQSNRPLFSESFFRFWGHHPRTVEALLKRQFPHHNPQLLIRRVTAELSPEHLALFLHPGIANRWGEFLEVAKSNGGSPYSAYREFSDRLGSRTLFRGILLNDDELRRLRSFGTSAWAFRSDEFRRAFDPTDSASCDLYRGESGNLISAKPVNEDGWVRVMMPFSAYPGLAAAVAYGHPASTCRDPEEILRKLGDKNLVLIEALVPELDILTAPHRLDHRQMGRFLLESSDPNIELHVPGFVSARATEGQPGPFVTGIHVMETLAKGAHRVVPGRLRASGSQATFTGAPTAIDGIEYEKRPTALGLTRAAPILREIIRTGQGGENLSTEQRRIYEHQARSVIHRYATHETNCLDSIRTLSCSTYVRVGEWVSGEFLYAVRALRQADVDCALRYLAAASLEESVRCMAQQALADRRST